MSCCSRSGGNGERVGYRRDRRDPHARGPLHLIRWYDSGAEAKPIGLLQPRFDLRHRTNLTTQSDLAEHDNFRTDRLIGERRCNGHGEAEIGPRFGEFHPTGGRDEQIVACGEQPTRRSSTADTIARRRPSTPWTVALPR